MKRIAQGMDSAVRLSFYNEGLNYIMIASYYFYMVFLILFACQFSLFLSEPFSALALNFSNHIFYPMLWHEEAERFP